MSQIPQVCLLANEFPEDYAGWIKVLELGKELTPYSIINLSSSNWLENIVNSPARVFIARPPGLSEASKQSYDEKIYIISKILNKTVYPTLNEVLVYENKRFLSYFLKANSIPHPETQVFYSRIEAEEFCNKALFPIVAKTNIGASGSGVRILKSNKQAKEYIYKVFSGRGAPSRWGPNLEKGNILKRASHYIFHPKDILKKMNLYLLKRRVRQYDYLIFQEYIKHDYEWRCVRIGESFFAHKKIVKGEKASGVLLKQYVNPPIELLDFIKEITDKIGFSSLAVDLFEIGKGKYLVNEMQCYFGQRDSYQLKVNGQIGRYKKSGSGWIFEEGDFAKEACFHLRYQEVIKLINK